MSGRDILDTLRAARSVRQLTIAFRIAKLLEVLLHDVLQGPKPQADCQAVGQSTEKRFRALMADRDEKKRARMKVVNLAPCPRCGSTPEFIERDLPTGTHASCRFVCTNAECGFRGPGIAQHLGLPGSRELHREWGRTNAAKEWNLSAKSCASSGSKAVEF